MILKIPFNLDDSIIIRKSTKGTDYGNNCRKRPGIKWSPFITNSEICQAVQHSKFIQQENETIQIMGRRWSQHICEGATRQQGEHRKGTDQMSPCSECHSGKENLRELVTWKTCKEQPQITRDCSDLFTSQERKIHTENGSIFLSAVTV